MASNATSRSCKILSHRKSIHAATSDLRCGPRISERSSVSFTDFSRCSLPKREGKCPVARLTPPRHVRSIFP
jgi:hypothetical protein